MFGLLGHSALTCWLRSKIPHYNRVYPNPIFSYCRMRKELHTRRHSRAGEHNPPSRRLCEHTITPEIRLSCVPCHDYCSMRRWCLLAACLPHVNTSVAACYPDITAVEWMIKLSFAASVSTVNYKVDYFSCRGKMKKLCIFLYLGHRKDWERERGGWRRGGRG